MEIRILSEDQTLRYAAEELKKYLELVGGVFSDVTCSAPPCEDGISLGLFSMLGLDASDVTDPELDDVIDVNISSLRGYIGGSNGRSVLMGVYKYFKSLGCRWVRPGKDGEHLVKAELENYSFKYRKKADYPFRGECCEGACSIEHWMDTVEWLPKVGMNLFMIQGAVPYNWLVRWYQHQDTDIESFEPVPYEFCAEATERLERLISKLGLQLHDIGHGTTCEPFGIRFMSSRIKYDEPSEEVRDALALVKGVRGFYEGVPNYTQLCMSKAWVRSRVVDWIVDYLERKPHVNFLHFWLGDAANGQCECEDCVKKTPCDFYVEMLNELDHKLKVKGNNSKIVFISYVDTLWPPVVERLNDPSRFIMAVACSTGTEYSANRRKGGIPKWERNNFRVNGGIDVAHSFIDGWKEVFDGPKFLFEYFMYTRHFEDPGYMRFSKEISRDMKRLHLTEFDGIMSCQTQRFACPSALPRCLMAELLFDTSLDTEAYTVDYFKACFGDDHASAMAYLNEISDLFDPEATRQHLDVTAQDTGLTDVNSRAAGIFRNEAAGDVMIKAAEVVEAFAPTVKRNLSLTDPCRKQSWRVLEFHGEYCIRLSQIYFALSRGDKDGASELLRQTVSYLTEIEDKIHPYFDVFLFYRKMRTFISCC